MFPLAFSNQEAILHNVKETWKIGEKANIKNTTEHTGGRSKESVASSVIISVYHKHSTF